MAEAGDKMTSVDTLPPVQEASGMGSGEQNSVIHENCNADLCTENTTSQSHCCLEDSHERTRPSEVKDFIDIQTNKHAAVQLEESDTNSGLCSPADCPESERVRESGSEDEYESAEEGAEEEDTLLDENLKLMEETLTDEEKTERSKTAQEYKEEGNALFKDGNYIEAVKSYNLGLQTCPLAFPKDRSIMYSNRAACKLRMEKDEEAITDCTKALDLHPHYLKALLRRAELYEKTDKLDEALSDFQKVVEMDPSQHYARAACMRLPEKIKERNEKLKEEMMGKLKDLGNMILKPFGLSTNNFQLQQDPGTGSYSVNFNQNSDPDNGKPS